MQNVLLAQIGTLKDFKVPGGDILIHTFIACHELTIVYFYKVISLHYTMHARAQFHSHLRGISEIRYI